MRRQWVSLILLLGILVPLLVACGGGEAPVQVVTVPPEVLVVTATPDPTELSAPEDETPVAIPTTAPTGAFTTPHPILSDVRVRQAIAYCTNRPELIASVYPFLDDAERQTLLMDTFLPQGHWALATEGIIQYPFDPDRGIALLEQAGWTQEEPGTVRVNKDGDPLNLKFLTTDSQFRITWSTVFEQQLMDHCGIQIIRTHAPGSYLFGSRSGMQVRDFELGAYAWVGQPDPQGQTLYACNQIPLPENQWEGQNYMGWCNDTASKAINAANNRLEREERIRQYAIVQQEFTKDMVSLPLFNRFEALATTTKLQNFRADPTVFSYVANIDEWEMSDGSDTVVIGFSQEPASLFLTTESAFVANIAGSLTKTLAATSYNYDYQPVAMKELPTIENGGAVNEVIQVSEGDMVWTTDAEPAELAPGIEVLTADGETVIYEDGTLDVHQLSVTFEFVDGLTWQDGTPVTRADFELASKIECDPESGAVSLTLCKSRQAVEFLSDTSYRITYLPGVQWPEYFVSTLGIWSNLHTVGAYPAHQEISDGRKLADVPAREWATLPEIAETPLSYGPYMLVEWQKGQRMIFEANPHYYKGEVPIKTVVIQFIADSNQAVSQLLTGTIDVLGNETLGGGEELETIFRSDDEGRIIAYPITSPTWEHVDMNLYLR